MQYMQTLIDMASQPSDLGFDPVAAMKKVGTGFEDPSELAVLYEIGQVTPEMVEPTHLEAYIAQSQASVDALLSNKSGSLKENIISSKHPELKTLDLLKRMNRIMKGSHYEH